MKCALPSVVSRRRGPANAQHAVPLGARRLSERWTPTALDKLKSVSSSTRLTAASPGVSGRLSTPQPGRSEIVQSSDATNADAGRRSPRKAGAAVTGRASGLPAQASRIDRVAEL
jgi:hypothetical protein